MGAILAAIGAALAILEHLWESFNSSAMVKEKVAQMSQEEKDAHNAIMSKAMHGTPEERQAALGALRKLVSE